MKALSLKQPYAELVVQGKKKIELRKWNTKFRGNFLVHASKTPDLEAMKRFGFSIHDLPLGGVVGKVDLTEVKEYKNEKEHDKDNNLHLASNEWGNYGFVLENPAKLKFIPWKGQLNFFDVKWQS